MRDPAEVMEKILVLLYGSVAHTIIWKIKRDVWVMWNMNQRELLGVNETAKEIVASLTNNSQFDGYVRILDNIGGYVAILNQEEVDIVTSNTEFSTGPLPNSFTLYGRGPDRGGGITAWVM